MLKKANTPSLIVSYNKNEIKIPFYTILYLEQDNHNTYIFKNNGEVIKVRDKISNLITQFDENNFISVHKSYVTNLNFVKYINEDLKCFCMINDKNIAIRREDLRKAKKLLEEFYFRKARSF